MATVSSPEEAARFKGLFDAAQAPAVREYLAEHDPISYSMLHTSISPNIIQGGYQVNVIPSEAEATLDIRALPDENIAAFYDAMRKAIGDPSIELVPETINQRPGAAPSKLDSEAYHALEAAYKSIYNVITIPEMQTGATDMAFLRAKGVQCYGVGAMVDDEDAPKGYGPHSDQERILEQAVYKHVQFFWQAVNSIAGARH
jgi:acetylornithine deacetylase/succinyl-diaminopimelate desuccinylase-like protein